MATRTVFSDVNSNEMDCYLNTEGKVYIGVGSADAPEYGSFITLEKEDVGELIKILKALEEQMEN